MPKHDRKPGQDSTPISGKAGKSDRRQPREGDHPVIGQPTDKGKHSDTNRNK
jgi:hypothetical protein